jgi:DNA-binding protein YbaB
MLKSKKKNFKNPKDAEELGRRFKLQLEQTRKDFDLREFESQNDDKTVVVVITGARQIKCLSIEQELIGKDKEWLESAVVSVVNEALKRVMEANIQLTTDFTKQFNEEHGIQVKSAVKG